MKTGVLGGTFDPVHLGHLVIAEEAREALGLDEVVLVPAGRPYFKVGRDVTEAGHRLAMVEQAVESNPFLRASEVETRRPGATYTIDTLVGLRQELGDDVGLYLILGLDALAELDRWHNPTRILDISTIVGAPRPGWECFDARVVEEVRPGASNDVVLLGGPLVGVSGSDIRRRVSEGRSIKYHVPEPVEAYIYAHGLYKTRDVAD